jgi:hypothetical protein
MNGFQIAMKLAVTLFIAVRWTGAGADYGGDTDQNGPDPADHAKVPATIPEQARSARVNSA